MSYVLLILTARTIQPCLSGSTPKSDRQHPASPLTPHGHIAFLSFRTGKIIHNLLFKTSLLLTLDLTLSKIIKQLWLILH